MTPPDATPPDATPPDTSSSEAHVPGEAGVDWQPWTYPGASAEVVSRQQALHAQLLARHPRWTFGEGVFVSGLAALDADVLELGDRSYAAAHVHLTGHVRTGTDCSLNAGCAVRGDVTLGDGVRVGAHAALIGFNHVFSDPDLPVHRQPLTSRGITVGDDVWVGAHVVVLDGVRVGSRSVLAAGAVVTRDVPPGAVVGGNPARLLRWRVPPPAGASGGTGDAGLGRLLERFGATAQRQGEEVLARCWRAAGALLAR